MRQKPNIKDIDASSGLAFAQFKRKFFNSIAENKACYNQHIVKSEKEIPLVGLNDSIENYQLMEAYKSEICPLKTPCFSKEHTLMP